MAPKIGNVVLSVRLAFGQRDGRDNIPASKVNILQRLMREKIPVVGEFTIRSDP